jgi:threonylcarbamoyladenosine tRNA methylthiotransferase CDKAL1
MNKVFVQTYGCTSNKADSQVMAGLLKEAGYEITEDEKKADYMIINTCAVKAQTEEKIMHRLCNMPKNKKIIVAGCLTKANPERIKKTIPDFAGMVDPRSVHKIAHVFEKIDHGEHNLVQVSGTPGEKPALPRYSFSKAVDIVKISEGCLSNCSFCATKLARGTLYSYRPDTIRDSVKKGLEEGYREFYLASEDSSAYGRDIGTTLPELISSISGINGDFFVRIGMMNPLHFKKVEISDLIESYKSKKIFKFLHLCVQSGSNNVLSIMKRGYVAEDYVYYVEKFKKRIPDMTFWTDIITGHPGETNEDFRLTLELLKKTRPDFANVSAYGSRLGTLSAKMKQMPTEVRKERTGIISELVKKISLENNRKWIGWSGQVIIDEYHKGKQNWIGRNYAYKPIALEGDLKLGQFAEVKVKDAEKSCLIGKIK